MITLTAAEVAKLIGLLQVAERCFAWEGWKDEEQLSAEICDMLKHSV